MKSILLLLFLFPGFYKAQSNVTGLGTYTIGITTPDSLSQAFKEQDQSYVKGTIALPCTHIRTFRSPFLKLGSVPITNLSLAFYDNKLFKLSCDYNEHLKAFFQASYGEGRPEPVSYLLRCSKQTNKPLMVWGETWLNTDVLAFVVHARGYTADCQSEDTVRLSIASQRVLALSSDCDVKNADMFIEEFEKILNDPPRRQQIKNH